MSKMNITEDIDLNSTASCILLQGNGSFLCDPQLSNAQCKPLFYNGDDSEPPDDEHRNCTGEEFLKIAFGPKRLEVEVLIPMTILYVLMFVTGVTGNFAVCIVIVRNKTMHTATNYYLFSLAISDLIILLLGLPSELTLFWNQYPYIQGEIFCKFRSYASEMASYASVLTIVSFSLERYIAICRPLYVYSLGDFQRAIRVISIDWIIAGLAAIPYFLFTTLNYLDYPTNSGNYLQDSAFCAMLKTPKGYPIHELATILFFIIPVGILMYVYISMAITLHRSMAGFGGASSSVHGERQQNSSRKQLIQMLAVVVIAFFLCWAPFHAQRLFYVYMVKSNNVHLYINEALVMISGICYYISSTINPILYNVMSARYRQAFKNTLCGCISNQEGGGGLDVTQLRPLAIHKNTTNNKKSVTGMSRINVVPISQAQQTTHTTIEYVHTPNSVSPVENHLLAGNGNGRVKQASEEEAVNLMMNVGNSFNGTTDKPSKKDQLSSISKQESLNAQ